VGYRLRVSLKPDAPPGANRWELQLKTNDPASPMVPLLVEATIQASLTASPGQLQVGSLKVGEAISKFVIVRASKPFKVVAVEGLDADIQADLPSEAAPVQRLTIKCSPTKVGEIRRQLRIKTNLEGEAPVSIIVEGSAVP
jgi:hypothetical protein